MNLFITAIPLFDTQMLVRGYRLNYQDGRRLLGVSDGFAALDGALRNPGLDVIAQVGIEPFAGAAPLFVEVSKFLLLTDFPSEARVSPKQLICVLAQDIPMEAMYLDKCKQLREKGCAIALKDMPYSEGTAPLFALADYAVFDLRSRDSLAHYRAIRNHVRLRPIFLNLDSPEAFDTIKNIRDAWFQGKFYNRPLLKSTDKPAPLKVNALRLLRLAGDEDFDLADASRIVERDPALSVELLKFMNSPAIAVRGKVSSIRHAVALLGQKETAKWIMVATSRYLGDDKPSEFTRLSLLRAKFAENLAAPFSLGLQAPSLFLTGLFSLLDVILDKPMERAVMEISVNTQIRDALVSRAGPLAGVLELILCYELADWQEVMYSLVRNSIDPDLVAQAYVDALVWYKDLLAGID